MTNPFSKNVAKPWTAITSTEVLLEYLWNAINVASASGASEATLLQVLQAIQNGSEFEARLVNDSSPTKTVWLEVRIWDTEAGTWGPISYYLPGSSVPGLPVLPVTYLDPNSLLTLMLTELIVIKTAVTNIQNHFTGAITSVIPVNISANPAYAVPVCHAYQLIVTVGTVTDGTVVYPVGTWSVEAPLKMTLPLGTTLNATGATAYVRLMNI